MNNTAFNLTQALQTASWDAKQWQTFFFVQDDFRVTPDLTLNLGLRYELSDVPLGLFGATDPESLAVLVPAARRRRTRTTGRRASASTGRPGPRTPVLGDGKTVFRGGFGMGYDVLFYNLLTVNGSNYPRIATASINQRGRHLSEPAPGRRQRPCSIPLNAWTELRRGHARTPTRSSGASPSAASSASSWSRRATRAARRATASTRSTPTRRSSPPSRRRWWRPRRTRTPSPASRRGASTRSTACRTLIPAYDGPGRQRRRGAVGVQRRLHLR